MRNTTQHNALRAAIGIAAAALVATPITLSLSPQDNQPATTHSTHTTAAPPAPPAADISTYEAAGVLMVGVNNYDDALNVLNQGAAGIFIGSWTDPVLIQQLPQLKEAIGRPFKVSIDAEGGRVVRQPALFGNLPSPRVMAATMTPQQVQNTAYDLGTRLHNAGINVDFAPVLDLDAGDPNGAIGDRSFSDNPTIAATYGAAFVQGLADAGVQPVLKHFPGHGHASGDSHTGDVTTPPLDALLREDLTPYATILQHCQPAIMFGHLDVPGLGDQPTTINPAAYELLRSGNYGGPPFTGTIYTDDLSGMRAISERLPLPEAAAQAIIAGADVALWIDSSQLPDAAQALTDAVDRGEITAQQLRDKATRAQSDVGLNSCSSLR